MAPCAMAGVDAVEAESRHAFPRHTHDQFGIGVIHRGAHRSHSGRGQVEAGAGVLRWMHLAFALGFIRLDAEPALSRPEAGRRTGPRVAPPRGEGRRGLGLPCFGTGPEASFAGSPLTPTLSRKGRGGACWPLRAAIEGRACWHWRRA